MVIYNNMGESLTYQNRKKLQKTTHTFHITLKTKYSCLMICACNKTIFEKKWKTQDEAASWENAEGCDCQERLIENYNVLVFKYCIKFISSFGHYAL